MGDLEQFSSQTTTRQHSKAIFHVIKDMFGLGIKEFSKSISHLFESSEGGKQQIPHDIAKREQHTIRQRSPGS